MAAHAEARNSLCQTHRVVEGAPIGHERTGSHDSASMSFGNGTIDARREAKVIGIDDQTAHRVSLAGQKQKDCSSRPAVVPEDWARDRLRLNAFFPLPETHPIPVR